MMGSQCLSCGEEAMSIVLSSDSRLQYECTECGVDRIHEVKVGIQNWEDHKLITEALKPICPLVAYLYAGKKRFADHPLQMLLLEVFHKYYAQDMNLRAYRVELAERLGVEIRDVLCSWNNDYLSPGSSSRSNRQTWRYFYSFIDGLKMHSIITHRDQGIDVPLHVLLRQLVEEKPIEAYVRRMRRRPKSTDTD